MHINTTDLAAQCPLCCNDVFLCKAPSKPAQTCQFHVVAPCACVSGCLWEAVAYYGDESTGDADTEAGWERLLHNSTFSTDRQPTAAACCDACVQAHANAVTANDPSQNCNVWAWWVLIWIILSNYQ